MLPLKSITHKVLLALALSIVMVMCVAGALYYTSEKNKAVMLLRQAVAQTSERLSNSLVYQLRNVSTKEVEKTVDLEMAGENLLAIMLYDEFDRFLIGKLKDTQGRIRNYTPEGSGGFRIKAHLAPVNKRIFNDSYYMGEARLYFTDRNLNRYLHNLAWKIILLTMLLSIITIIITYYTLHRIVLTPILNLQDMTRRLRSTFGGETVEPLPTSQGGIDEIDLLGRNFNSMAYELTQYQSRLQHTANHLQALLDETPDAVASLNGRGMIINVNKTFLQMFGETDKELLGIPLADLAANADLREIVTGYIDQVKKGQHTEFEWQAVRKNKESFPVLVRMRSIVSGDEPLLLAVITDITERKQTEEALRSKTAELEGFFSSAVDLLCIADMDGYFRRLNQEWQNVTGYNLSEMEGHRFLDLIHPDDVEPTLKTISDLEMQHEVWNFTNRYRCKDGSYRWLEWHAVSAGKLIYAAARDITKRIQTEEALSLSENRLRAISDNLPGGMIYQLIIAPDGARRFTYVSASVERMHEVTADEVLKDTSVLYNQILEEDRPGLILEENRAVKQMTPFNKEARSRLPSGAIRWMKITSQPRLLPSGEVVFDGVEMDVTDLKQAETRLLESVGLLQATLESTGSGILMVDLNRRIVNYNERFIEMWHIPDDVISSMESSKAIDFVISQLADPEAFRQSTQALYQNPSRDSYDIISFLDGRIFERFSHPTYRGNDIIGRVWSFNDITAQKRAERDLRESEERFSKAFHTNPAPMVITDLATGRFLDANERWLNLVGYTREEMIGATSLELNIYAETGTRERMVERLKRDGFFKEAELRARSKSGTILDFLWSAEIINLGGQEAMLSLLIDVTERKLAEEALQESKNALTTLLDNTYDAIFLHDMEGRVTDANRRMLDLYQVTREQVPFLTIYDYSSPDNPLEDLPTIWNKVLAGDKERFEWTARRPNDGSTFPVEVFLTKIQLGHHETVLANVRDITERKQAETQILESLGLFRASLESTANGILVTDMGQKVVHYNHLFAEMWRIPEEILATGDDETILQSVADQLADPDAFIRGVQYLYDHPEEQRRELILFKDGRIFERYSIPTYRGNEIVGRVWNFNDITLEKQADNALRESEAKYRLLHESMTDAFARVDMSGRLIETNKAYQEMLGYPQEELSKLSYEDLTPAKWHAMEAEIIATQVMRQGFSDIYEKEYIRKDGTIFPVELRTYLVREESGQPIGLWAMVRDITERRQSEEALRESEALFRSQFEYGNIGIAITSSEKSWLRVNQYICDLLGYSEEELKGKTWAEMTHPEDMQADVAQFNRLLAGEIDAYEMDKRYLRKDGEIIVAHLSVSCFRNADRSVRFVISSLLDITETAKAVEKLRTSETTIRALMNATADALFVTDKKGILLAVNDTLARRFGQSVDKMLGTSINDYLPAELARQRLVYLEQAIVSGQPVHFVDERQGMWFENTFYPISNSAGTVVMLAAYSRDITLRKHAESKLQQYQEHLEDQVRERTRALSEANDALIRFRRFAEASGQGFGMATLDGTIIYANATLRRLVNDDNLNEAESVSFLYRYPDEYRKKLQEEILPLVLKDEQWIGELALVTAAGHIIPTIENYFLIRDEAGSPALIADVVTDIRDMKRTENELKKYRDHLEDLVKKRTWELQKLNKDLQKEIIIRADAEKALRESEQRYRTLFDNAPIGISIMKPDLKFDYFNPRFTEMLGYTLADLPDKNTWFVKAYPDDDYRQQVMEIWRKDLNTAEGIERKGDRILRVRVKNGQDIVIHFRTAVLENGEHLMSYEDVTELQKLNDALRDSEARYRTLFENAPVGIGLATMHGKIINANGGLLKLFRLPSMEDAFRLELSNIYLDPDERSRLLERILKDGSVPDYETTLRRVDNSSVDVIMTMSLFSYEGEKTILTVIQDVSWKKQAEEETRHLKNYLANIIDSMPSMLVGVDIDGQVTQWNTAAEKTTGLGAELARGQDLEQVLPLLSHHIDLIRQAMRANRAQTFSRLQSAIKGENRFLDVTVYPLVSNGVSGAVVRVDDVTDRIRMEEMMIQSEKMLSVGGLAAGMAHEINNPLGVIMAASQNVLRRITPDLAANLRIAETCGVSLPAIHDYLEKRQILTFLEDIRNGVVRANQIVTNMLSFSRRPNEGGAQEDMASLLDQTLLLAASDYDLKKKYDFRQIHIKRDYHPETPKVFCQASKIQQVFLNILRNGAEAMEENHSSEHPPCFKLRVFPDQDRVRIEICDNGPGMDESTRRRIFEPFFTTKPPGVGTGLGLSVSYFIITQNHDGAISVESSPGKGACFIIELPVKEYPV